MKRVRRLLKHPFVIVPPIVLLLIVIWQQHTFAGRGLNLPLQNANLLANSYNLQSPDGIPAGWSLNHSGNASVKSERTNGNTTNKATKITIDDYRDGDVTLTTSKMTLVPDKNYLLKGYYTSDIPFSLIAHYYYRNGDEKLVRVNGYPLQKVIWSTASHAFNSGKTIAAVQFVYKFSRNGQATFDNVYLEQRDNIYIDPPGTTGPNVIPNSTLVMQDIDEPDSWTMYQTGDNTTSFAVANDDSNKTYLKTSVTDFKNGEAKWEYDAQPVKPHERYQFRATYRSDKASKVIAEYLLEDGKRQFSVVSDLLPASQWTDVELPIETPSHSKTLTVSIVMQQNGTVESRDYALTNITKPGAFQWKRPLVSITMDDGWKSQYTNALPVLDRLGYRATFYINPSSIETPNFMTANDLAKVSSQNHEIAVHGYSHKDMTTLSTDALDNELRGGKEYLANAGYPSTTFATPFGKSDAEVEWFARKYFTTLRGLDNGINTKQNLDAYNLRAYYVDENTTTQDLIEQLGEAAQYNGWLIITYHNIGSLPDTNLPPDARKSTVTTETFANQLSEVQKSGITVLSIKDAFNEVANQ